MFPSSTIPVENEKSNTFKGNTHENACHTTNSPGHLVTQGLYSFQKSFLAHSSFLHCRSAGAFSRWIWEVTAASVANSFKLRFTMFHSTSIGWFFLFFMSNFHDCRISLLEINTCIDAGGHYVRYFLSAVVWYQKRKVPPAKKNTKTYTCLHRKWVLPLRWLLPIISNIIIYYLINLIVMDPTCTTCTTLSTLMFRDVSTTIRLTLLWDAHLRPRIAAHLFGSCDCAAAVGPVGRPPWISHGHSMPFHAIHRGWNGLNRNRMK